VVRRRPDRWASRRTATLFALAAAFLLVAVLVAVRHAANQTLDSVRVGQSHSLLASMSPTDPATFPDRQPVELGLQFTVGTTMDLVAARFFRSQDDDDAHEVTLWDSSGAVLSGTTFAATSVTGWQSVDFPHPVTLTPPKSYVLSYHTSSGYAVQSDFFKAPVIRGELRAPPASGQSGGVYSYGPQPTSPTRESGRANYWIDPVVRGPIATENFPASQTSRAEKLPQVFPGVGNTGVPTNVVLAPYDGPMRITTPDTVLDAKEVRGVLRIATTGVVISRSKIQGSVLTEHDGASFTIADSEVDGGEWSAPAIGYNHVRVSRSEVRGGQHSVACGSDCLIEGSWLHGQHLPRSEAYHNNAFISNGGSQVILRGNTLHCTPQGNSVRGGCTADASFFGDFSPISDVLVTGNLFKATAGGYCGTFGLNLQKTHGASPMRVVVRNNVFERGPTSRCGLYGAATGFGATSGSSWTNNKWLDGAPLPSG
jgi:hypothetical protein